MNRWSVRVILILGILLLFPYRSPAPLIYRPGEGWTYETPGKEGKWQRERAKDQLDVAQKAFDQKKYSLALKASKRVIKVWPLSDYAPQAQYLIGRCYEAKKQDEKAFDAFQTLMEKYPKVTNFQEIQQRQFEIANRFLAGQWFKLFGYIPFFPSMEKTSTMYDKVIKNGPYSDIAPKAQMNIGAAREKQKDYLLAVRAYERAADRYSDQKIASDALFKAGLAGQKEAGAADYDQSAATRAIGTFSDFSALYPEDSRVPKARKAIEDLKSEQARGSFRIAKWYEKRKHWQAAMIYYNEVSLKDAGSPLAAEALARISALKEKTAKATAPDNKTKAPAAPAPASTK